MSFSLQIKAKDKADAKALAHEARELQRPNLPHPVLDFINHAIDGIQTDGPIIINGSGHLATPDSHQVSGMELVIGPAEMLGRMSEANRGVEQPGPAIAKLEEQLKDAQALFAEYADTINKQKAEIEALTAAAKAPMVDASFEELSDEIRRRGGTVTPAPHSGNGEEQHPPGDPEE